MTRQLRPYGSWRSPITSDLIAGSTIGLGDVLLDGEDVYWIESRPSEKGRSVIVRGSADGKVSDAIPAGFNARTRVHEYGGGAFLVDGGEIFFSNFADQRLYHHKVGSLPLPLTSGEGFCYADALADRRRDRLIAVREDQTGPSRDSINEIVSIALDGTGRVDALISGADFYSFPRVSPDGNRLAWTSWNHPNMPWDGTELWVAELKPDGTLGSREMIAGGKSESIFQPEWSPDGTLHFISDRSGWWNLYRVREGRVEPLCEIAAEFGAPQWVFRMSTYAFESADLIVCAYNKVGSWQLATLDTRTGKLTNIETPYTEINSLRASQGRAVFSGGSPTEALSVVQVDLASGRLDVLRRSSSAEVDPAYLSVPRALEFPTEGGLTAHAFHYPPTNPDYEAPAGERPPLLVISHGGPTGATTTTLKLGIQYWTSRGMGVLDVNYGGSTGYGRAYRERLNEQWGVVDVDDCINGARYLVERGDADPERLIIRGGSAGGYTTLAALTFRNVFKAGASYYGVSDLEALEQDCHKFESRYNTSLVGPYPELMQRYKDRSPIHFTDRLSCPMILFQGLEDKVVPPNQAEMMFEAVRKKGLPVAYIPFEGEQHGFRRAENIKRSLDGEFYFYSKVFGFEPADPIEPVPIENLTKS
ncbi:MAG TPA: prolyl oligopeptidase family serine peptidase [Blastocatellia bacterium]|nr:prolyl oligopeptidase family serine peptidase [Blastocatellia bacterium]